MTDFEFQAWPSVKRLKTVGFAVALAVAALLGVSACNTTGYSGGYGGSTVVHHHTVVHHTVTHHVIIHHITRSTSRGLRK